MCLFSAKLRNEGERNGLQITGELAEDSIKLLLIDLLKIDYSKNFKIDELPVEEAMKSFFTNPNLFLND